jgi:hypothetical protein
MLTTTIAAIAIMHVLLMSFATLEHAVLRDAILLVFIASKQVVARTALIRRQVIPIVESATTLATFRMVTFVSLGTVIAILTGQTAGDTAPTPKMTTETAANAAIGATHVFAKEALAL